MEESDTNEKKSKLPVSPMMAVGIVVAIAVVGGAFLLLRPGSQNNSSPTQESSTPDAIDSEDLEPDDSGVTIVEVEGKTFSFESNEIRAKVGEPIRIVFTSVDVLHDFVVDGLNVRTKRITKGNTDVVEFIPEKAGEFEFFCSVGNHRAQGMVGTLIVE